MNDTPTCFRNRKTMKTLSVVFIQVELSESSGDNLLCRLVSERGWHKHPRNAGCVLVVVGRGRGRVASNIKLCLFAYVVV